MLSCDERTVTQLGLEQGAKRCVCLQRSGEFEHGQPGVGA